MPETWSLTLDKIIDMLRGFHAELPDHVAPETDESHVRRYLDTCYRDGSLVYALQPNIGLALGVIFQDWTRPVMVCGDIAFFLLPSKRGRGALARNLYAAFEATARAQGAKAMLMSNQHPDFEDIADRFYQSQGFHAIGRSYQKEI